MQATKSIYQPHARIIHHEGLTSGTSLESGVKSYQVVNQKKFRRRWSDRLDFHPPAAAARTRTGTLHPRRAVTSRGRVLVIDHRLPFSDQDCGSLRMMEMIRALPGGPSCDFRPRRSHRRGRAISRICSRIGVEVIHRPYYDSVAEYLKEHGREFSLAIISRLDISRAAS